MDLRERDNIRAITTRHPWELAREKIIEQLIGTSLVQGDVIVDIGCGDLFLLQALNSKFGNQIYYYAVDIALDDQEVESLQEQNSKKNIFVYNSIEKMQNDIYGQAKIILLLDVIEHIEDDVDFLTELTKRPFLSEQTNIIITVPAYQCLFSLHDKFLGHYRRYTNNSLIETINKSGLEKIQAGYFFTSLVIVRALQSLIEKITHKKETDVTTGLVTWTRGKTLTHLIKNVLLFDYSISRLAKKLKINLPGLSNYLICQKRA